MSAWKYAIPIVLGAISAIGTGGATLPLIASLAATAGGLAGTAKADQEKANATRGAANAAQVNKARGTVRAPGERVQVGGQPASFKDTVSTPPPVNALAGISAAQKAKEPPVVTAETKDPKVDPKSPAPTGAPEGSVGHSGEGRGGTPYDPTAPAYPTKGGESFNDVVTTPEPAAQSAADPTTGANVKKEGAPIGDYMKAAEGVAQVVGAMQPGPPQVGPVGHGNMTYSAGSSSGMSADEIRRRMLGTFAPKFGG
jgi:hypothetical protein